MWGFSQGSRYIFSDAQVQPLDLRISFFSSVWGDIQIIAPTQKSCKRLMLIQYTILQVY